MPILQDVTYLYNSVFHTTSTKLCRNVFPMFFFIWESCWPFVSSMFLCTTGSLLYLGFLLAPQATGASLHLVFFILFPSRHLWKIIICQIDLNFGLRLYSKEASFRFKWIYRDSRGCFENFSGLMEFVRSSHDTS